MRRIAWMVLAAGAAFLVILLLRLPAAWALRLVPASAGMTCHEPAGTLWAGRCGRCSVQGVALGALEWTVHPAALLRGRLAGTMHASPAGGRLDAQFEGMLLRQSFEARALRAQLELDPALAPQLPPRLRGRVSMNLSRLHFDGERIDALAGRIVAHDLRETGASSLALGDYELVFEQSVPTAAPVRGTLRDLGGPLGVQGSVTLTPEPGYLIEGLLSTRPATPPELLRELRFLGTPDAEGRRPFSVSGTF